MAEKIVKFDNDLTMKVIMAKEVLIVRNGTEQAIKMPNDFVDQLSKQEKSLLLNIHMPFVVGGILKDQKTTLQAKDIILALNNEPAKYFES
jgi:regulator of sigma E protease